MRTFVCVLAVLGVASAQLDAILSEITTTLDANTLPAETVTNPAAAAAAPAANVPASVRAAAHPADPAAAAAAATGLGTIGLNLGPAFYGPGLNNAQAIPPNGQITSILQNYLKQPGNANKRVFVDISGQMHVTDQFGQELEILDPTVSEFIELGQDPFEMHERLVELRQQSLEQAVMRCETQLRQRFFTDPASFTPALLKGVNIPSPIVGASGAGIGVGARAVVRA